MKKRLNNKGYMLVEIILASAIAIGVAAFITNLTIKLKNKNDDLLVKTLVYTDQAIIYNEIAKDLYSTNTGIYCNDVRNKLSISGNKFTYNGFTNIVSEYAQLGSFKCEDNPTSSRTITITIPITVKQLPKENFNVKLTYTNSEQ